jgi:hypothetical protein
MSDSCFDRFDELCREDRAMHGSDADNIGTYNEKRFHRVFKRFVCEDASCYEVKIGRYVADVLCDGHVTEIQTGRFSCLRDKIEYYLNETDYTVSVVKPLICKKRIIRADRDTGEVLYSRVSPKKEGIGDALCEIYALRDNLCNKRLRIHLIFVEADEYRYSERVRYRKSGAYEKDLFPIRIVNEDVLCGADSYGRFLPNELYENEFRVKDYSRVTGIRGRAAYSALNILCSLGFIDKRKEGNAFVFKCKNNLLVH